MILLLGLTTILAFGLLSSYFLAGRAPLLRRRLLLAVLTLVAVLPILKWLTGGLGFVWSAPGAPVRIPGSSVISECYALFTLGATLMLIRLVMELWRYRNLASGSVVGRAETNEVVFYLSAKVSSACVCGVWKPRIYLPLSSAEWTASLRRVVLSHEKWHLRWHDSRWLFLAELVRAILWYHPLAHILVHHLRQALEDHCDDCVVREGHNNRHYAECLLQLAAESSSPRLLAAAMSNSRHTMERRLLRILRPGGNGSSWPLALLLGVVLVLLSLLTMCHDAPRPDAQLRDEARERLAAEAFPAR